MNREKQMELLRTARERQLAAAAELARSEAFTATLKAYDSEANAVELKRA